MTSLSLIAPTELWITLSLTSSVDSRSSASASASTEPCTSALRMSRSSFTSPDWICFWSPSSVIRVAVLPLSLSRSWRIVATCRALRSSDTATRTSPAAGTPPSPWISTGSDGPAHLTFLPLGSISARIRPEWAPTTTASPSFRVPFWISTVATGPRPRSSRLSMITPRAARFWLAFSSSILDWYRVTLRKRFVPWRVQERNLAVPSLDLVGADVLRDSPELLLGDLGLADRVEERGLAVVDVAHDRDDGRAQLELGGVEVLLVDDLTFDGSDLEIDIELVRDELRGRRIEQLVDGRHDAELEQRLDDLARLPSHLLGEFAHRDRLGHPDQLTLDLGRRRGRLDGRGRRRCWR